MPDQSSGLPHWQNPAVFGLNKINPHAIYLPFWEEDPSGKYLRESSGSYQPSEYKLLAVKVIRWSNASYLDEYVLRGRKFTFSYTLEAI